MHVLDKSGDRSETRIVARSIIFTERFETERLSISLHAADPEIRDKGKLVVASRGRERKRNAMLLRRSIPLGVRTRGIRVQALGSTREDPRLYCSSGIISSGIKPRRKSIASRRLLHPSTLQCRRLVLSFSLKRR